jgi:hypothetical protein
MELTAPVVSEIIEREANGTFKPGQSGNNKGRPKGSQNQLTLMRRELELVLREQMAPEMLAVLAKAVELAKAGHPGMIKMLMELNVPKGLPDDGRIADKVEIKIGRVETQVIDVKSGEPNGESSESDLGCGASEENNIGEIDPPVE